MRMFKERDDSTFEIIRQLPTQSKSEPTYIGCSSELLYNIDQRSETSKKGRVLKTLSTQEHKTLFSKRNFPSTNFCFSFFGGKNTKNFLTVNRASKKPILGNEK